MGPIDRVVPSLNEMVNPLQLDIMLEIMQAIWQHATLTFMLKVNNITYNAKIVNFIYFRVNLNLYLLQNQNWNISFVLLLLKSYETSNYKKKCICVYNKMASFIIKLMYS